MVRKSLPYMGIARRALNIKVEYNTEINISAIKQRRFNVIDRTEEQSIAIKKQNMENAIRLYGDLDEWDI
jgi:hypothetical protein